MNEKKLWKNEKKNETKQAKQKEEENIKQRIHTTNFTFTKCEK